MDDHCEELVHFDFDTAFATKPQHAVNCFQALLLHVEACEHRVALLQALQAQATRTVNMVATGPQQFSREIALIREVGTFVAWERGELRPERLAALSRDPDALLAAQRALVLGELDAEAQPASFGISFSSRPPHPLLPAPGSLHSSDANS